MSQPLRYTHIEDLSPREPVGAVVTIGRKGPSGAPVETDRFFVVVPQENENRIRVLHPQFKSFNEAPIEARQTLRGNLVHSDRADAFVHHLRAQVLGKAWAPFDKAHPHRRPVCSGDGKVATRLYGIGANGVEDWREIPCPNDACEFRQGDVKVCKPFARIFFRPRWKDGSTLPTPLAKLTTQSWNSISALVGFFDYVEAQARNLGIEHPSLYGLPFTLALGRKTSPHRQRAYPVLAISPECDLIEFFVRQREQARLAGGGAPILLAAGNRDAEETTPDAIAADVRAITPTPPGKPSEAEPVDAEVIPWDSTDPAPAGATETTGSLSAEARARIFAAAEAVGLNAEQVGRIVGGPISEAPASAEPEILRSIRDFKPATKKR